MFGVCLRLFAGLLVAVSCVVSAGVARAQVDALSFLDALATKVGLGAGSSYGDLMRIFEQASDSIPATAERTFHSLRKPPAHSGAAAGRKALTTFSLLLNVHFSKHESTHMIA